MSGERKPIWGTPAEEMRLIAKECAAMGRPDLALAALSLAREEDEQASALAGLFGGNPHDQ